MIEKGQAEFRERADAFMAEALAQREALVAERDAMDAELYDTARWVDWKARVAVFNAWIQHEAEAIEAFCRERGVRGERVETVLARVRG
jgi:hypothetical protein